jgi:phosphoenolpyruvate carboxykinase (GTP)
VFLAATMGSEATAAAFGQAAIRRDPFAMLPFTGYNMADYWKHWLGMEGRGYKLPRIFRVNWFRKDENVKFIWPGYGQNMRAVQWIVDRVHDRAGFVDGPLGRMPRHRDLVWKGLDMPPDRFAALMELTRAGLQAEAEELKTFFARFGDRLPAEIEAQRRALAERAARAPEVWRPGD